MKLFVVGLVVFGNNGVEFNDKHLDFVYELQDTFGKDDNAEVFADFSPAQNGFADHA